ncbi:MAG TPA: GrpB family protein [Acidimicrobiales bacterium]|nr:GrpB family protein [Acidimicrobiales bacterium]
MAGAPTDEAPTGADPADDALFAEWRRRREAQGPRVAVLELYQLVADARGVAPTALPLPERKALAARAMTVIWPGFEKVGRSWRRPVHLDEWQPEWGPRFEAWRRALAGALGPTARRIDHVGSTAIEGLCAKPVVDVQVSVVDLADEDAYVPGCERVGLELDSRDHEHRFLLTRDAAAPDVHVHVCEAGGAFERDHLLFRDYLRADATARARYVAVKREAAATWADDRMGYTYAKNGLIVELLERAGGWARSTGWTVEGAPPDGPPSAR